MNKNNTSAPEGRIDAQIKMYIEQLKSLLKQAALRPDSRYTPCHDEILLQITQDKIDVLGWNAAKSVISYNTYRNQYFDDIVIDPKQTINAVLDPCWILDQADIIREAECSNDDVLIEVAVDGKSAFASSLEIHADLTLTSSCPAATKAESQFPVDIRKDFNQTDGFQPSGNTDLTTIETTVDDMIDIIKLVDMVGLENAYPIKVDNNEFRIDAEQKGNFVKGTLSKDVQGPDFKNYYAAPFERVVKTLPEGAISLQSGNDQNLAIVQRGDNYTVRNVISQVNSP